MCVDMCVELRADVVCEGVRPGMGVDVYLELHLSVDRCLQMS